MGFLGSAVSISVKAEKRIRDPSSDPMIRISLYPRCADYMIHIASKSQPRIPRTKSRQLRKFHQRSPTIL